MLTDFKNFVTLVLGSDYVMNWSLTIPPHLKRVDTLPCKTLCVQKIDLISTLINTSYSLFIVRHELTNRIIVSSDIWSHLAIPAISHHFFTNSADNIFDDLEWPLFRELCLRLTGLSYWTQLSKAGRSFRSLLGLLSSISRLLLTQSIIIGLVEAASQPWSAQ